MAGLLAVPLASRESIVPLLPLWIQEKTNQDKQQPKAGWEPCSSQQHNWLTPIISEYPLVMSQVINQGETVS